MAGLAFEVEEFNERIPPVTTGWVSVHREVLSKGAHLRALTDPNAIGVAMIVSESPSLAFCGNRLVPDELAVTSEGQLDLYALGTSTLIWVNVDRRLLDAGAHDNVANIPVGLVRPEREALAGLRTACLALFSADPAATMCSGPVGTDDGLVRSLNGVLHGASVRGLSKEALRRCDLVRRAEEFMWSHVEEAIDPASVARALSCSVRKLLYYFKRTYDLGPIGYFKIQRLNAVRNVLLSDRSRRTIADVAADYGFWHMGHFGTAYRQLFGLTPSQTRALTRAQAENETGRRRPLHSKSVAVTGSLRLPANRFARVKHGITIGACV